MSFFRRKSAVLTGPPEYIIAGLGNPGKKYEATKHNTGFVFIDLLAQKYNLKVSKINFKAVTAVCDIEGARCLVMKPQTFMNNSGESLREASKFYKIPPEKIIVIYDDVSLKCGSLRIRRKGSDGGHNGIKSIIYHLNSDDFPRIKIGVGQKPCPEYDLADWVLSPFEKEDAALVKEAAEKALGALELMVKGDIDLAMSKFNC